MLEEIPDRGVRVLTIEGEPLLLARSGDAVTCFVSICPHRGVPLGEDLTEAGHLFCVRHGYRYDLATGACLTAPDLQLQPRASSVVAGRVLVRLGA
jgi:nitrite reductase/ring-hydroxylating ferredoxin subunit